MSVTPTRAWAINRIWRSWLCIGWLWLLSPYAQGQAGTDRYFERDYNPPRYLMLPDSGYLLHHVTGARKAEAAPPPYEAQGVPGPGAAVVEFYNLLLPGPQVLPSLPTGSVSAVLGPTDTLLITFALLPFKNGTIAWERVALDTVRGFRYTLPEFAREAHARIQAYRQAGSPGQAELLYRSDIRLIVRRNGEYWTPQPFVLTGYFVVKPQRNNTFTKFDLATINIRKKVFSKDKLMRQHGEKYVYGLRKYAAGNVLTHKEKDEYDFWLSPSVVSSHPSSVNFGYSNFRYKPGIGIISGTFENYFTVLGIPSFRFFDVLTIDGRRVGPF